MAYDHAQSPRLGQAAPVEITSVRIFEGDEIPETAWDGQIIYRADTQVLQVFSDEHGGWRDTVSGVPGVVTFVGSSIPVSQSVGDLWFNTADERKLYRAYSVGADEIATGEWELMRDEAIPALQDDVANLDTTQDQLATDLAANEAAQAQLAIDLAANDAIQAQLVIDLDANEAATAAVGVTANGKNKVRYETYAPTNETNTTGDIWYVRDAGAGNSITAQYEGLGGTSWTSRTLTNVVVTSLDAGVITTGTLAAARIASTQINASNITTGTLNAANISVTNLSASSITTGTLNAANVSVINLNAANITTGTISASQLSGTAVDGKTVTGAVVQTGFSPAKRMVMNGPNDRFELYNGLNGEQPSILDSYSLFANRPGLVLRTGTYSSYTDYAELVMSSNTSGASRADLNADTINLNAGIIYSASGSMVEFNDLRVNGQLENGLDVTGAASVSGGLTLTSGGLTMSGNAISMGGANIGMGGGQITAAANMVFNSGNTINTTNPPSTGAGGSVPNTRFVSGASGGNLIYTTHANSSLRYKKNFQNLSDEIDVDRILAIQPLTYAWREEAHGYEPGLPRQAGFIAEDLNEAGFTQWVGYDEIGRPDEVDYAKWTIPLHFVAQEHHRELQSLRREVAELRAKIK